MPFQNSKAFLFHRISLRDFKFAEVEDNQSVSDSLINFKTNRFVIICFFQLKSVIRNNFNNLFHGYNVTIISPLLSYSSVCTNVY